MYVIVINIFFFVAALALSDKSSKPSTTKVDDGDVDKYGDDGDISLSKYAKEKECACKKDDKEEKEKKQKEKEIQFQIHFEDALHNQVYVKRLAKHILNQSLKLITKIDLIFVFQIHCYT